MIENALTEKSKEWWSTHEVVQEALVPGLADVSHEGPLGGCALQGAAGGAHNLLQGLLEPVDVLGVRQLGSPNLLDIRYCIEMCPTALGHENTKQIPRQRLARGVGMQGVSRELRRAKQYRGDVEGVADAAIAASHLSLQYLLSLQLHHQQIGLDNRVQIVRDL